MSRRQQTRNKYIGSTKKINSREAAEGQGAKGGDIKLNSMIKDGQVIQGAELW
jgi:hypothetical protein